MPVRQRHEFIARVKTVASKPRVQTGIIITAVTLTCLAIWFLRRPGQLTHPYVWAEEYLVINRWAESGFWSATFSQYQGYLLVPTSAIVAGAAAIDFRHLPVLQYWMTTALFVATILLLLIPKSRLPLAWRCGMAFLLVLAPMNPEVYGVALYAYWWTALWPLISLFWERNLWWLRVPVLIVGGLSGFAGAVGVVLYGGAFLLRRKRSDLVGAGILAVFLGIQLWVYSHSQRGAKQSLLPRSTAIQFFRNFGSYDFGWMPTATEGFLTFFGLCVAGFVAVTLIRYSLSNRSGFWTELLLVAAGLGIYGTLSAIPVPLVTQPISAGPRYFFYPFVLTAWLLFLISVTSASYATRVIAITLIGVSTLTLAQGFSRAQVPRNWSEQLSRCKDESEGFSVSVYFDGSETMWIDRLHITRAVCRRLK